MTEKNKFLLPPGFRDLLPETAEQEYFAASALVDNFYKYGYRLVATPLVEFEESLFEGAGKALEPRTLKFTDPLSQKSLGIRADITTQVSRLISSRLGNAKLPLKLCYSGDIIRSYALNTRGQRQLKQAGVEFVDKKPNPDADAEVAILALESLIKLGIKDLTIDLNAPNLIGNLGITADDDMQKAINKRDTTALPKMLAAVVKASGSADKTFAALAKLKLPKKAAEQIDYCAKIYKKIKASKLPVNITADFAENRGFEYHKTFSFSIFAREIRDEIGRGGRYSVGNMEATGFTLYVNAIAEHAKIKLPAVKK